MCQKVINICDLEKRKSDEDYVNLLIVYAETLSNLKQYEILEVGRAVVKEEYRDGITISMLWKGVIRYAVSENIDFMIGTASFHGINPYDYEDTLSYLYYNHLSPLRLRATVLSEKFADGINPKMSRMNILPREFVDEADAKSEMTPLIKGYLRLGATFGRGVFIDKPFNSYDVFVMMETRKMNATYQKHFLGRENALGDPEDKDNIIKTVGKIITFPVVGSFKVVRALVEFLLHEDAADAEYIEDAPKSENED